MFGSLYIDRDLAEEGRDVNVESLKLSKLKRSKVKAERKPLPLLKLQSYELHDGETISKLLDDSRTPSHYTSLEI